jgi:hypothetical protein
MNGFNPTFSDTQEIIDYDITSKINSGLMPAKALSNKRYKFDVNNSNLTIKWINFTEYTFRDFSSNALFVLYYGDYRRLTLAGCHFNLKQLLVFTQDGVNT